MPARIKFTAASGVKLHYQEEDEGTGIVLQSYTLEAPPLYRTREQTCGQILDEMIAQGHRTITQQQEKTREL